MFSKNKYFMFLITKKNNFQLLNMFSENQKTIIKNNYQTNPKQLSLFT